MIIHATSLFLEAEILAEGLYNINKKPNTIIVDGLFSLILGRGVGQGGADVSQLQDCGSVAICRFFWNPSLKAQCIPFGLYIKDLKGFCAQIGASVCARVITNKRLLNNLHPAQPLLQPWPGTLPQFWSWLTSAPPCPTPIVREKNPSTTILEFSLVSYCCCEDTLYFCFKNERLCE